MLSQNLIRRFLLQQQFRPMCVLANEMRYGDSRMPDRLYKTLELEIRGAEPAVIRSYVYFVQTAAKYLDVEVGKVLTQKKATKERWSLLKSAFGHRRHFVQYEVRTHYTWIHLHKLTGSTGETFLEYIERMLPEGVALKVTRIAIEPLSEYLTPEEVKKSLEE